MHRDAGGMELAGPDAAAPAGLVCSLCSNQTGCGLSISTCSVGPLNYYNINNTGASGSWQQLPPALNLSRNMRLRLACLLACHAVLAAPCHPTATTLPCVAPTLLPSHPTPPHPTYLPLHPCLPRSGPPELGHRPRVRLLLRVCHLRGRVGHQQPGLVQHHHPGLPDAARRPAAQLLLELGRLHLLHRHPGGWGDGHGEASGLEPGRQELQLW